VIAKPPVVAGVNPVTAPHAAFGVNEITSVEATPDAEMVKVAQLVLVIAPRLFNDPVEDDAVVPVAIVWGMLYAVPPARARVAAPDTPAVPEPLLAPPAPVTNAIFPPAPPESLPAPPAPPVPEVIVIVPPAPPTVEVVPEPVAAPPVPPAMAGELPTPPVLVPVDEVAPPATPLILKRVVAVVPLPPALAGAVPASVNPELEVIGYVKVASAVGLAKPDVDLSSVIAGRSPEAMVPHTGAALTVPLPVWTRKFLVLVVLPARRVGAGVEFS